MQTTLDSGNTNHTGNTGNTGIVLDDSERQPCEIWTRVMGYHRPLSSFNTGKQGEFHDRKYFVEPCQSSVPH